MPSINLLGTTGDVRFDTNYFSFSSFVSSDNESYIYTSGSRTVMVYGTDITVNAGRFVSGTITDIVVSETGSPNSPEFEVTDMAISGTSILGSNGGGVPTTSTIWNIFTDGETIIRGNNGNSSFAQGDGYNRSAGVNYGFDDEYYGKFTNASFLYGDHFSATSTATIFGGDDIFGVAAFFVSGDVFSVSDSANLFGGDDMITMRAADYNNGGIASGSVDIYGDAYQSTSSGLFVGGDDVIDASAIKANDNVEIFGDARSNSSSGDFVSGDDEIRGADRADNFIYGDVATDNGSGNFVGGDDTIFGGGRDDVIYGDVGSSTSSGNGGNDRINGLGGDDTMYGNGGRDNFFKDGGTALIYGGNQKDVFRPDGDGSHTFYAGSGDDVINYARATGGRLTVDLWDSNRNTGWAEDDVISSVENILGSKTQNNFIYGSSAGNRITGGDKSDRIEGRGGGDEIETAGGNDRIEADYGANTYDGGSGFDILSYDASSDGVRVDLLSEEAWGGDAAGDTIMNIEHLYGTSENDKFWGDNARNIFKGYEGNDSLYGRNGADALYGGADNDKLYGGFGDDIVEGGGGNDKIFGGRGNDFLRGGNGEDVFHFDLGDDIDTIRDFQRNVDRIELDGFPNNYKPFQKASQVGNDVVFNFGNGDRLIVEDIQVNQLFGHIDIV